MKKILNNFYSDFINGKINNTELESFIFDYLINNQEKTCLSHWKKDQYEDFISWFYTKLKNAINSYNDIGSSFEAFIAKYLHVSAKEYHVRATINSITEYSAWSARVSEMYAHEEQPVYQINQNAESVITNLVIDKKGRKNSKRILALILKCYYYVSEDFAEKIAPLIGLKSKILLSMLYEIREKRQEKDDKIFLMREQVYRQYYRCIVYEKRLDTIKENSNAYNELKIRIDKAKQRLERMRGRLNNIKTDATNKQIAEVIGITKGTVDASLCRLKIKWEKMSKNAELN